MPASYQYLHESANACVQRCYYIVARVPEHAVDAHIQMQVPMHNKVFCHTVSTDLLNVRPIDCFSQVIHEDPVICG